MQFDENGNIIVPDDYKLAITVSYDEKPGIQAIANTSDDLRPADGNGEVYRDYEYKRLGTVSLLAGIDLLVSSTGHHPDHRQPFRTYIKRNESVPGYNASMEVCVCVYPETWVMAEYD